MIKSLRWRLQVWHALVLLAELEGIRVLILPELGPAGRERLLERSAWELVDVDIVLAEVTRQNAPGLRSLLKQIAPQLVLLVPAGSARESWPPPSRLIRRNQLEMVVLEATAMPALRLHQGRAEVTTAEGVRLQIRGRRQP